MKLIGKISNLHTSAKKLKNKKCHNPLILKGLSDIKFLNI